jgi:hypothetical protein
LVDLVVTWCCYRYQHDPDMFWWFLMDVDHCAFLSRGEIGYGLTSFHSFPAKS